MMKMKLCANWEQNIIILYYPGSHGCDTTNNLFKRYCRSTYIANIFWAVFHFEYTYKTIFNGCQERWWFHKYHRQNTPCPFKTMQPCDFSARLLVGACKSAPNEYFGADLKTSSILNHLVQIKPRLFFQLVSHHSRLERSLQSDPLKIHFFLAWTWSLVLLIAELFYTSKAESFLPQNKYYILFKWNITGKAMMCIRNIWLKGRTGS